MGMTKNQALRDSSNSMSKIPKLPSLSSSQNPGSQVSILGKENEIGRCLWRNKASLEKNVTDNDIGYLLNQKASFQLNQGTEMSMSQ